MNKTSEEFDKECGAKGDKWKGGKGVMGGRDSWTDTTSRERLVRTNKFGRIRPWIPEYRKMGLLHEK